MSNHRKKKYKIVLPTNNNCSSDDSDSSTSSDRSNNKCIKKKIIDKCSSDDDENKLIYDYNTINISSRNFDECFSIDNYWEIENNYDNSNDNNIILEPPNIIKNSWFIFTLNVQICISNKTKYELYDNKLIINLSGIFNNAKTITYIQSDDKEIILNYSTNNEIIILSNDFNANIYNMDVCNGISTNKIDNILNGIITLGNMKSYGSIMCNLIIKGYSNKKLNDDTKLILESTLFSKIVCSHHNSSKYNCKCSHLKNKIPLTIYKKINLEKNDCIKD
jgi:hypothetical protein